MKTCRTRSWALSIAAVWLVAAAGARAFSPAEMTVDWVVESSDEQSSWGIVEWKIWNMPSTGGPANGEEFWYRVDIHLGTFYFQVPMRLWQFGALAVLVLAILVGLVLMLVVRRRRARERRSGAASSVFE